MAAGSRLGRAWGPVLLACALCPVGLLFAQETNPHEYAWEDPAKINTADKCRRCHTTAYEVWQKTPHARGFKTLHRRPAAEDIAEKMGFKLIKRESLCLTCHYTPVVRDGTLLADSGVSCESCHGAGLDWMPVHNQYGPGADLNTETAEHRAERLARTRELGMRRPSDLYPLASRCFQCHTVPHEELVNVGGHGTGSSDFEYVSWSQGEIRHNFLDSFLHDDGTVNAERPQARKRVMYVLGRCLDVEYSLRGVAVATEQKRYFKAMSRRLRAAVGEVRALQRRYPSVDLAQILDLADQAPVAPNRRKDLLATADQIGAAIRNFVAAHDGEDMAAIDGLMSGEDTGLPEPAAAATTTPTPVASAPATSPDAASPTPAAHAASAAPDAVKTVVRKAAVPVQGTFKSRIRPPADHQTIGPGQCSGCHRHEVQSTWWFDDAHYRASEPFFEDDPKVARIARFYGLAPGDITRGTAVCMDCHGTVISGKEQRQVTDGVSCESCHGAAADYLEIHQSGDAALGETRPGYLAALKAGMQPMKQADVRAKACADCHYITDERLLSAGHHDGSNFDYAAGMGKIKHWTADYAPARLKTAYAQVLAQRGAVPKVRLAADAEVETTRSATPAPAATKKPPSTAALGTSAPKAVRPEPVAPRPVDPTVLPQNDTPVDLQLETFPDIDENTTLPEILRLVRARLLQMHRQVNGGDNP